MQNGVSFTRLQSAPEASFFLFGPRGTGKSAWVRATFPGAPLFDLLDGATRVELLAAPERLGARIPLAHRGPVVIDAVQKVPEVLDEVHRLIESRGLQFVLTGSSARKLRRGGVNLLAGRARTTRMFPLTAHELGGAFDLARSVRIGHLPAAYLARDPDAYLRSYVETYVREEVQEEALTRNLAAFARFLEAASFSQAQVLNVSALARDAALDRKLCEGYLAVLEDLLLATRLPAFTRRAKRRIVAHPKLFYFDPGVFRAIRPRGPLDSAEEIDGPALETLVLSELRAHDEYARLGYAFHYWRTSAGNEVDFVLYGEHGLVAIEVKRAARLRGEDTSGLRAFLADYPMARAYLLYGGTRRYLDDGVEVLPVETFLRELPRRLTP